MDTLETAFGIIVILLAALAVIGALVFAMVLEVCAIRRTIERHRRPGPAYDPTSRWWRERSALEFPEHRP